MLEHGGHLIAAAKRYNIPKAQWIDLSTGINPTGWPIPSIPADCWQRLPETADNLHLAAQQYYGCSSLLPVAGSQAAIQALPLLREKSKIGVIAPAYAEHAHSWQQAGHEVITLTSKEVGQYLPQLDVLVLINPNNPTGEVFAKEQLLHWQQQLSQRNGWLVVDEAFIDGTPEQSLSTHPCEKGLIILRSIGKFFGLAGIRCGFVMADEQLLNRLNEQLGPWTISHPSRYVATAALQDIDWQRQTQQHLKTHAKRLAFLLAQQGLKVTGGTLLFQWVKTEKAPQIYHTLAQQGVLVRLFDKPKSVRFGLPHDEQQWQRLEMHLKAMGQALNTD